jgi:hypothetical protein
MKLENKQNQKIPGVLPIPAPGQPLKNALQNVVLVLGGLRGEH